MQRYSEFINFPIYMLENRTEEKEVGPCRNGRPDWKLFARMAVGCTYGCGLHVQEIRCDGLHGLQCGLVVLSYRKHHIGGKGCRSGQQAGAARLQANTRCAARTQRRVHAHGLGGRFRVPTPSTRLLGA